MKLQQIGIPLAAVSGLAYGYYALEWKGLFLVLGGLVMWALLHFTRLVKVLERAANRPIGHVDSAVMLNAKLKPGVTLMHVVAMTQALGQQTSAKDAQPECFRWTDGSESYVDCEFIGGKLTKWALTRPAPDASAESATPPLSAPAPGQSNAAGVTAVQPDSAAP